MNKNKDKNASQTALLSDTELIELFWKRDQRAIVETDAKYRRYLYTVAFNILNDDLDCEETLNDTYLGTWNAIPPTRPKSFKAFLTVILRRYAINRYNHNTRRGAIPSEMSIAIDELEFLLSDTADLTLAKELAEILSRFILSLSLRKRLIFMGRYYECEPIEKIARDLSLSVSTVKKELFAIKNLLKKSLETEGYSI